MRSMASARGARRLSMVSWTISGFVAADSLHRFADFEESHGDGIHDDLNGDRAMCKV